MNISIKNIKVSCKIPDRPLSWIKQRACDFDLDFKVHQNFVVVSFSSTLKATFFKRGAIRPQHSNVTGIPNEDLIEHQLSIVELFLDHFDPLQFRIDNITAVCHFPVLRSIILEEFAETLRGEDWRLNREIFCGLTIRKFSCTGILYSSGSLVIVGAKTRESCEDLSNFVLQKLWTAYM